MTTYGPHLANKDADATRSKPPHELRGKWRCWKCGKGAYPPSREYPICADCDTFTRWDKSIEGHAKCFNCGRQAYQPKLAMLCVSCDPKQEAFNR